MILFDVLGDILFFKRGDKLQNMENESEVSPYMINRWMSMHSPLAAQLVNEGNNRYWSVLQNKQDWYRYSLTLLPRNRYTKIEYVKKEKKEKVAKTDDDKIYAMLAQNLELSIREVKSYIQDHNIDLTNLRKILKNEKRST